MSFKKNVLIDGYILFLTFPLITVLVSSLWAALLLPADTGYLTDLIPEGETGIITGLIYTVIFIVAALISGVLIYYLIEKDKETILKCFLGFSISFVIIIILPIYTSLILSYLNLDGLTTTSLFIFSIMAGVIAGFISAYSVLSEKAGSTLRNIFIVLYSSIVSSFIGVVVPTLILIFIFIGLSLYDIYSVVKGPIRKTIQISERKGLNLKLYVSFGSWDIGVGDLVFYSILVAHTLLFYGLVMWLASMISLSVGLLLTFLVLNKKEIIPGLPIALLTGMIPLVIAFIFF
ncbi:MAG: hypothetical protein OdinLCB4_004165 [Candidatus Odinarchaeum yellowstonii]|jgi:hypothetical protein|uniref:Uncharacterized protein n=1 Tax=Odinarchaeota yellowstonii (strain LCB_4) TaxID=1841599 RepID=A0AAF0IB79_ODILC|nr:MAG: hypothetical protein OdinLCB4_004165 [Candidatus Odinarchaeum yellowstonii]